MTGSWVSAWSQRQKTVGISFEGLYWRRCVVYDPQHKRKDKKCSEIKMNCSDNVMYIRLWRILHRVVSELCFKINIWWTFSMIYSRWLRKELFQNVSYLYFKNHNTFSFLTSAVIHCTKNKEIKITLTEFDLCCITWWLFWIWCYDARYLTVKTFVVWELGMNLEHRFEKYNSMLALRDNFTT